MKEDRAIELAEALESGKYKQAVGALKDGRKYCCLGVACRVAGKSFRKSGRKWVVVKTGEAALLPDEVQEFFGFRNNEGASVGGAFSLITMNDNGRPFTEIAAVIRKHWREL